MRINKVRKGDTHVKVTGNGLDPLEIIVKFKKNRNSGENRKLKGKIIMELDEKNTPLSEETFRQEPKRRYKDQSSENGRYTHMNVKETGNAEGTG